MTTSLTTDDFLQAPGVMLDVRSPAEYDRGHIPDAVSFPLFNNDERAEVGICYKQQGRDAAVELGLAIAGPKLAMFVAQAKQLAPDRVLRIHCWRGGMRSGSMAWLLETAGFQVFLLNHGYKGFRHWGRATLAVSKPIILLGGMTGTGKTEVLHQLADRGESILDLEHWASHRGSSYGNLGLPPQPTTEHFENLLAIAWAKLPATLPIWIEAESRMVGTCRIPDPLFQQMRLAPVLQLERSRPDRIARLLKDYGTMHQEDLIAATARLQKRLGGERTQQAIAAIQAGDLATAVETVLDYYDRTYLFDLQRRGVALYSVPVEQASHGQLVERLQQQASRVLLKQTAAIATPRS